MTEINKLTTLKQLESCAEAVKQYVDSLVASIIEGYKYGDHFYTEPIIQGYYYNSVFYYDEEHTQPISPQEGEIYVDLTTGKTYKWNEETAQIVEVTSAEIIGETGKIYVDLLTDNLFRWNGSAFEEMSKDLGVAYTSDSSSNTLLPIVLGNATSPTTGGVKYNSNINYTPSTNTLKIGANSGGVGKTYITPNTIEVYSGNDYRSFEVQINAQNKDVPIFYYNDSDDNGYYTLILPKTSGTIATDDVATTLAKGLMSASDKQELAQLRADIDYVAMMTGVVLVEEEEEVAQ